MQVKKFEARSMKEALEMVKRQLGPEAIILSARDHGDRFGLVGDGSVEITAAVSDETLQKKKFAESRMKPELREKFLKSPAKDQRKIMDRFVDSYQAASAPARNPGAGARYVDIRDDSEVEANLAETRIKAAASKAWDALRSHGGIEEVPPAPRYTPVAAPVEKVPTDYQALKAELESLKKVFSEFKQVPQGFSPTTQSISQGISFELSPVYEKLTQAGLSHDIVVGLLNSAQENLTAEKLKSRGLVEGWIAKRILDTTEVVPAKTQARVHCFIGPRGSGKSSSLVKLASQFVIEKHKTIAILTTDNFKVGAVDQMRIYSQILNVPFGIVKKASDWEYFLENLKDVDYIFCDFPGLSLKTNDELSLVKNLLPQKNSVETHLVLSTLNKEAEIEEFCRRYKQLAVDNLIFNHLDEASQHGSIYNSMRKFQIPLHSFGIGARLPEDIEMATKERVLDLIFKLTKLKRNQE